MKYFANVSIYTAVFSTLCLSPAAFAEKGLKQPEEIKIQTPQQATGDTITLMARQDSILQGLPDVIVRGVPEAPIISRNGQALISAAIESSHNSAPDDLDSNAALLNSPQNINQLIVERNRPLDHPELLTASLYSTFPTDQFSFSDNGCLTYRAALQGPSVQTGVNDQAILAFDPASGLSIAQRLGDQAVDTNPGGQITALTIRPLCASTAQGERLALSSRLSPQDAVLYQGSANGLQSVARSGDSAENGGVLLSTLEALQTAPNGDVLFLSVGQGNGTRGLYRKDVGQAVHRVLGSNMPLPGEENRLFYFTGESQTAYNRSGRVAVGANGVPARAGGLSNGIWSDRNGTLELIAHDGDSAIGLPNGVRISLQGTAQTANDTMRIADNGAVLFSARLVGGGVDASNDEALFVDYAHDAVGAVLVAREGSQAHGMGENVRYKSLGYGVFPFTRTISINGAGKISFAISLDMADGSTSGGIFSDKSGNLMPAVLRDEVLDGDYRITAITNVNVADSILNVTDSGYLLTPVFVQSISTGVSARAALRVAPNGTKQLLLVENRPIEIAGQTVEPVTLFHRIDKGISETGEVVMGFYTTEAGYPLGRSYVVRLKPANANPADFNGDGVVSVPDIFAFLSAYFAQDMRADIDGNGLITVPDIFAFLSLYFSA